MPPSKKKTYTIKYNNIVSDKGAKTQLKITKTTHTTLGCVGDLTTASKKLTVKLVDNINNNIIIILMIFYMMKMLIDLLNLI